MSFKPISYGEEERGRNVPSTKRRYLWIFQIEEELFQLQLFCSFISSKRRVVLNEVTILETRSFDFRFQWSYEIKGLQLKIKQDASVFQLTIQNRDFIEKLQEQAWGWNAEMVRELCRQSFNNESSENRTISNIKMNDFKQYSSLEKRQEEEKGNGLSYNDVVITFHDGKDSTRQIKQSKKIESNRVLLDQQSSDEQEMLMQQQKPLKSNFVFPLI